MQIGISAELIGTDAGGPATYVANLITALGALDRTNHYRVYLAHRPAQAGWFTAHPNFSPCRLWGSSRWLTIPFSLPWELLRRPVDLFHASFVAPPLCPARLVLTVVDLGFERYPAFFPPLIRYRLSKLTAFGAQKARKIIAISHMTKRDLMQIYGIPGDKIAVTHLGVGPLFQPRAATEVREVLRSYGIDGEYILYVGKLQTRKNILRLLHAFDLLRHEVGSPLQLVLVGKKTWLSSQVRPTIEALALQDIVRTPGHVAEAHLPYFYSGARLFVYPSLFEGFGLPPLEAMACGTPVVASNSSALPEVLGDAALLVDAYDVQGMATAMHRLLRDSALRQELIARGYARARLFSWEETARQTLAVYQEALAD